MRNRWKSFKTQEKQWGSIFRNKTSNDSKPVGLPLGNMELWAVLLLLGKCIWVVATEAVAGEGVDETVDGVAEAGGAQVVVVAWLLPLPANNSPAVAAGAAAAQVVEEVEWLLSTREEADAGNACTLALTLELELNCDSKLPTKAEICDSSAVVERLHKSSRKFVPDDAIFFGLFPTTALSQMKGTAI